MRKETVEMVKVKHTRISFALKNSNLGSKLCFISYQAWYLYQEKYNQNKKL